MRQIKTVLFFIFVLLFSTAEADDGTPMQDSAKSSGKNASSRFSMLPFQNTIVLLDSKTGKTWILMTDEKQHTAWHGLVRRTEAPKDAPPELFEDVHIPYIEEIGGSYFKKPPCE